MKTLLPVFILLIVVLSASKCKDDTSLKGSVDMIIKAQFNNQPLILNKAYDYNDKKVRFSKLTFFMSNVHTGEINKIVAPITLVSFKDNDDSTKAAKGLTLSIGNIEIGDKKQLGIGIGVSQEQNTQKPKDYPSSNPLSDGAEFWDAWNSYIFTKLEGSLDKDGDGKFETGITLHTGGNEVYQNLTFEKVYSVAHNQKTPLNFELNLNKLIEGIDLMNTNSTHQTSDLPTMKRFTGNFVKALTIQ